MINLVSITAVEFFTGFGYFLLALLCLMFMIVVHEFGHMLAGRLLHFKVDEFAVGFGPVIVKYTSRKSNTKYSLRCIPIGGFCAFRGEESDEAVIKDKDSFLAQKPWKRIIVFAAGAIFNLISAIIVISVFFMSYGDIMPTVHETYAMDGVQHVLQKGDIILEVDGKSVYTISNSGELLKMLNESGDSAQLTISRGGEIIKKEIKKGDYQYKTESGDTVTKHGYGMTYNLSQHKFGFFESIGRAFMFCFKVIGVLFATIGGVFTGALSVSENLGGTATAIGMIMDISRGGFGNIMYVICIMSATIGVFNLMPLPALDGSKIVFTTIEWIRGKPINRRVENIIHTVGIVLLLGLTITLDLVHFLS